LEWKSCYRIREVAFDPYQLQATAQNMRRSGIIMNEFLQTPGNLSEVATRLYNLIAERKVQFYSCPPMRTAFSNAIAVETTRGWKIDKAKQSHRIDLVIALGMATTAAMRKVETGPGMSAPEWIAFYKSLVEKEKRVVEVGRRDGPTTKLTAGELRRFEMQAGYCTDCGTSLLSKSCTVDGGGMHCGCDPAPIPPKPGTIISHTADGPRRVF
jgi:hypothetical protein